MAEDAMKKSAAPGTGVANGPAVGGAAGGPVAGSVAEPARPEAAAATEPGGQAAAPVPGQQASGAERPFAALPGDARPPDPYYAQNAIPHNLKDAGRAFLDIVHSAFQPRGKAEEREAALTDFMPAIAAARLRRGRHSARWTLLALSLTFFVLIFWAAVADIEETVVGMGQVIPSQRVQHIQNLEGGILREILVSEGQNVDKGDLLLRIDNEQAGSAYRDAVTRSLELEATIARLEAEINGVEPVFSPTLREKASDMVARHTVLLAARQQRDENERKTLEAQLELRGLEEQELLARRASLLESLEIATRQRDMAKKLMQSRSYSEMEYLNLAQHVTQLTGEFNILDNTIPKTRAAIREAEEKLRLHQSEINARNLQELNTAQAELATLREIMVAGEDKVTRTEVRSPVRGVVKRINITTPGGVIMPGEIIMDVVPLDDSLIIEARVSPQDIAFLFVGQKAKIRLTAYDFAIYGALDAELENISADTIEGKQGEVYYLVKLRTAATTLEHNGRQLPILPGMMATADIITGKKTVLDYLMKPILKAQQTALRER